MLLDKCLERAVLGGHPLETVNLGEVEGFKCEVRVQVRVQVWARVRVRVRARVGVRVRARVRAGVPGATTRNTS